MDDIERYFKILGLNMWATAKEVKEAYMDLVKVWHPDRFANDPKLSSKAQEKLKEINEAYRIIKDFFENPSKYQPAPKSGQKEHGPEEFWQGSSRQSPDIEDKGNTGSKEFKFVRNLKSNGPLCWIFMALGSSLGYMLARKIVFTKPAEAGWVTGGLSVALMALGYFVGYSTIKGINNLTKQKQGKNKLAWVAGISGIILYFFASVLINAYIQIPNLKSGQPKIPLDVEDPFQKESLIGKKIDDSWTDVTDQYLRKTTSDPIAPAPLIEKKTPQQSGENWVFFFKNQNGDSFYYDKNAIEKETIRIITNRSPFVHSQGEKRLPPMPGYSSFLYSMWQIKLDCENRKYSILDMTDYDNKGLVLKNSKEAANIFDIIHPGSAVDFLYKKQCQ